MPQLWRSSKTTDFLKIVSNTNKIEESMNQEKLYSLKENFTGQKFQWIKTQDPNLLGKVVKCRDVDYLGNKYIVIFDDGSRIDSDLLNRNLLMIHGDMQPLSRDEVISLNGPQFGKTGPANIQNPQHPIQGVVNPAPQVHTFTGVEKKSNMFTMFNVEESTLNLKINIKLPDKKLLKMMYNSSENKQEFMEQLAEYLGSKINKSIIVESMKQILETPSATKQEVKPQIKIREIDESK